MFIFLKHGKQVSDASLGQDGSPESILPVLTPSTTTSLTTPAHGTGCQPSPCPLRFSDHFAQGYCFLPSLWKIIHLHKYPWATHATQFTEIGRSIVKGPPSTFLLFFTIGATKGERSTSGRLGRRCLSNYIQEAGQRILGCVLRLFLSFHHCLSWFKFSQELGSGQSSEGVGREGCCESG